MMRFLLSEMFEGVAAVLFGADHTFQTHNLCHLGQGQLL